MKTAWWNAPLAFDLAKTISPILNSLRLLIPSNNIRKKDQIPCHHPPLKIKVLQTTKISKLGLVFLPDQIKTSLTLNHTSPFPQTSPGGPWTRSFSIPLVPIKSPQARFLNHHKSDFLKFNQALLTSRSFLVRKFLSCKLHDRKFLSCKLHDS